MKTYPSRGELASLTAAVLALLFVVPAFAQDVSPFQDLDRYPFGYAYPGSQLKDHIYQRSHRLFAAGDAQRDAIGTVDALRQLAPNVKGCEWRDGFTFTDFVRTRAYDSKGIRPFILPGVLRYFDVDEL